MSNRGGADTGLNGRSDHSTGRGLRRRHLLTATGSAVGISAAGCLERAGTITGSTDTEAPVTIGTLAPDPDSDFIGRAMVRGARVAVDELNENGGILGRDVEMVVGDTNASPLEARRQYQRLCLEEGADVTVGVFDSPSLVNILDDIAQQERIHLTTGAATSVVSEAIKDDYDRYKYHFRVGPTNDYHLGQALVDFLEADVPGRDWNSVALLAEAYDWTEVPWNVVREGLDGLDVEEVMAVRYPPATENFAGIYEEVDEANADVAFSMMAHTGNDALGHWRQPTNRPFAFGGIHVPMQMPTYWQQTGGLCEYGISQVSATANSSVGELTQDFVAAYRDAYDATPVYTGYTTYEAVMLYAHVAEDAGTLDEKDLIGKLESVSFPGATGAIEFYGRDEQYPHDLVYNEGEALYFQWQRDDEEGTTGTQEVIWPESERTAEFQTPPWLE